MENSLKIYGGEQYTAANAAHCCDVYTEITAYFRHTHEMQRRSRMFLPTLSIFHIYGRCVHASAFGHVYNARLISRDV